MSLDPFHPDDVGDASATFGKREQSRPVLASLLLICAGVALLAGAALVAVLVA